MEGYRVISVSYTKDVHEHEPKTELEKAQERIKQLERLLKISNDQGNLDFDEKDWKLFDDLMGEAFNKDV